MTMQELERRRVATRCRRSGHGGPDGPLSDRPPRAPLEGAARRDCGGERSLRTIAARCTREDRCRSSSRSPQCCARPHAPCGGARSGQPPSRRSEPHAGGRQGHQCLAGTRRARRPSALRGHAGRRDGRAIERDLERVATRTVVVHAPGDSRTCTEIVEIAGGGSTQAAWRWGARRPRTVALRWSAAVAASCGASWLALCGSPRRRGFRRRQLRACSMRARAGARRARGARRQRSPRCSRAGAPAPSCCASIARKQLERSACPTRGARAPAGARARRHATRCRVGWRRSCRRVVCRGAALAGHAAARAGPQPDRVWRRDARRAARDARRRLRRRRPALRHGTRSGQCGVGSCRKARCGARTGTRVRGVRRVDDARALGVIEAVIVEREGTLPSSRTDVHHAGIPTTLRRLLVSAALTNAFFFFAVYLVQFGLAAQRRGDEEPAQHGWNPRVVNVSPGTGECSLPLDENSFDHAECSRIVDSTDTSHASPRARSASGLPARSDSASAAASAVAKRRASSTEPASSVASSPASIASPQPIGLRARTRGGVTCQRCPSSDDHATRGRPTRQRVAWRPARAPAAARAPRGRTRRSLGRFVAIDAQQIGGRAPARDQGGALASSATRTPAPRDVHEPHVAVFGTSIRQRAAQREPAPLRRATPRPLPTSDRAVSVGRAHPGPMELRRARLAPRGSRGRFATLRAPR